MITRDFIYERPETLSDVNPNEAVTDFQLRSLAGIKDNPIEFSSDIFDLLSPIDTLFPKNDPLNPPVGVGDNFFSNSYFNNPLFNSQIVSIVNDGLTLGDINVDSTRYIILRVLSPATSHTVTTTVGGDFESPIAGTISAIGAWVDTAGVTGTATIDVHKNGTTLMTTDKISIETTEKSSRDAATQPVLTTTTLAVGDLITIDIDAKQTTAAKGLIVRLTID